MITSRIVNFDSENRQNIRHIRNTVFTKEQHVAAEIDFDGQDNVASHAIVYVANSPVATGRILQDGHIGRVAVLKEHRSSGLGSEIIAALEQYALSMNYSRIYLGSQLHAQNFYTKLGFTAYGQQYTEANIRHVSMEKQLS